MPEILENHMVTDSCWHLLGSISCKEDQEDFKESRDPGYENIATGVFVSEEDAYDYALERVSQDEDLKQEFVEWFYSDNWIKED